MKSASFILFSLFAAGAAQAQVDVNSKVQIEAQSGPVTVVSVQPPIPNAEHYTHTVADLDKNGDGHVVRSEVPGDHALASEFTLVDTDRNGRITDAELSNWK